MTGSMESLRRANARLVEKVLELTEELARARHSTYRDSMTGLPNRSLLRDRLEQSMALSARYRQQVALLKIDVDGFKHINDRLGEAAGDQLLQQVAQRLSGCVRRCDTVCRYGGDEFVVMLPEIASAAAVHTVVAKIRARLHAPYALNKEVVSITATIGTAIYRGDGQDCDRLLDQADSAMCLEKAAGGFGRHAAPHGSTVVALPLPRNAAVHEY